VGSARTALFNWLVARQDPEGVFILRIEDTDAERNREEWVEGISSAMAWPDSILTKAVSPERQRRRLRQRRTTASTKRLPLLLRLLERGLRSRKAPGRLRAMTVFVVIEEWSAVQRRRCAFARRAKAHHRA